MDSPMETFVQKLAKKKESEHAITILPMLQADRHDHEAGCGCGEGRCAGESDGGCCGG